MNNARQREEEEKRERTARLRQLQFELFALENAEDSLERKEQTAEIEVKRLKTAIAKLEAELHDKEAVVAALNHDIDQIDEEISHQKKKMSAV